jgi:UDP-N-acetylglucosamine acyltransferase
MNGVDIGPNVIIGSNTTLAEGVRIYPGAVIGTDPQDLKYDGSPTYCEIGAGTIIREYATVNRGSMATRKTIIGKGVYMMAYAHVAHDCRIGDRVIMANNVAMGGHCEVDDGAIIGGLSALHQFVRVGKLAMISGMSGLRKDGPPYMITAGVPPASVHGLNSIGLKRAGFSPSARASIKEAYRLLYRSGLSIKSGLERIERDLERTPEIEYLIDFLKKSKRGVSRGVRGKSMFDEDGIEVDDVRGAVQSV